MAGRAAWGCEARCGAARRRRGGTAVWSWRSPEGTAGRGEGEMRGGSTV